MVTKSSRNGDELLAVEDPPDRRQEILKIASILFAQRGFDSVSMREIAGAAGILGGSLYHHFKSKRALYIEVHRKALSDNAAYMSKLIEDLTDPWEKLEVASAAHIALQVDPESISMPIMADTSAMSSDMRRELVKDRDKFELIYKRIIAELPLPAEIDRDVYRLCLVSLLNAVAQWYRPGRMTVEDIAHQIAIIFQITESRARKPRTPKRKRTAKSTKK